MNQPTSSDIMRALHELHGDVKVALDRTNKQDIQITALNSRVTDQGLDIANAKGQATVLGAVASSLMVVLIEGGKALFRGGHTS